LADLRGDEEVAAQPRGRHRVPLEVDEVQHVEPVRGSPLAGHGLLHILRLQAPEASRVLRRHGSRCSQLTRITDTQRQSCTSTYQPGHKNISPLSIW
jgi:hypothetical protein